MRLLSLVSATGQVEKATVLIVLVGGVLLFVVGRRRGTLPGAGLVVLAAGMSAPFLHFSPSSWMAARLHLAEATAAWLYSGGLLLLTLAGWGLVLAALFRFRAVQPEDPEGTAPEADG